MELHRLEHIISWHSAALKLLLKVKGCESTSTRTLWLSSLLSAIPQTRPQTFCFPCPTFLIASLLSEQKAIFLSAMNHLCRSVSQFQIINWSLGRKKQKTKIKVPRAWSGPLHNHNVNVPAPVSCIIRCKTPSSVHTLGTNSSDCRWDWMWKKTTECKH